MKKGLHVIIAIVICAALCVGYYFYLSHRSFGDENLPTEMQQLLSRDLESSYPTTPKEVMRFYNRILRCLYNGECEENEVEDLGAQARKLMDESLLAENPDETYYHDLKAEVNSFQKLGKRISNMQIADSKDIETRKNDGVEYAYVEATYTVIGKKETERSTQTYILRKGEDGRWRIFGFYQL